MEEENEEVYTTIFNALRHGVRRNILRMLNTNQLSFSSMEEALELSSSHLTYHLDSLGDLVSKTDTYYKLSLFGKAAVDMMENVENPPNKPEHIPAWKNQKTVFMLFSVALIIVSGLYLNQYRLYQIQNDELEIASAEVDNLKGVTDGLAGLPQLFDATYSQSSVSYVTRHELSYYYRSDPPMPSEYFFDTAENYVMVFYAPMDDMVLRIYLSHYHLPEHMYMPLTLQKGNAFLNESTVIAEEAIMEGKTFRTWQSEILWSMESRGGGNVYEVNISKKGWYTLCLTGPIVINGSDPDVYYMWRPREQWVGVDGFYVTGFCVLQKNGRDMFFGLENIDITGVIGFSLDGL